MSLKNQIIKDLAIFFNQNDFSKLHTVGGKDLLCIVDNEQLKQNQLKSAGGIYEGNILFYAKEEDLAEIKIQVDSPLIFDSTQYLISNISPIGGILEITLRENRGY